MSEEQQTPEEIQPEQPVVPQNVNTPPPSFSAGQPQFGGMGPQSLPNATIVLILGILSIPACCCYGILGLILGIIAWVLGNSEIKKFNLAPNMYTEGSLKNARAGKVCGIIGTVLSALYIILIIVAIATIGLEAIQDPEALRQWAEGLK
jgi:hypothetical protein